MISSVVTLLVLLFAKGQSVNSNQAANTASSIVSSTQSSFKIPTPSGKVKISIEKAGTNKYNLMLDTMGTKVTALDLRFSISDGTAVVLATKGNISDLNDLFNGRTDNNELSIQAGSIGGYTGSGILATLSLADTANVLTPTLSLESTSFVNSGSDININELSNTLSKFNFTLE